MDWITLLYFAQIEGAQKVLDQYGLAGLVMACLGYWIWKKDTDFRETVRAIVIEKDDIISAKDQEIIRLNTICRDQNAKYTKEMNELNREFLDFFKGDDHGS